MLWVFPPFDLIPDVLNKLLVEPVNAILILPRFNRFWRAVLMRLPCHAQYAVKYHNRLYTIGSMAPKHMREHKPVIHLIAYRICFSQVYYT